ncbi:3-oxoacyl-[acyl-carrier-protein] synthase III, chloroplastic, partial [Capsicum baccatum]
TGKAIHWLLTLRLLVAGSCWACFQLFATSKLVVLRIFLQSVLMLFLVSLIRRIEIPVFSLVAAGAVLVQACDIREDGLFGFDLHSDDMMNAKEIFKFVVRMVPQSIEATLEKAGLASSNNFDWLLLHQAKQRIIDGITTWLEVPSECVISNLANYGNTSITSIPLALDKVVRSGKVQSGHVIAPAGFEAGLTWASTIFRWG